MSAENHFLEHKKRLQLDRMILFSDAVFAIVITLLVIEIKVPNVMEVGNLNSEQLNEHLIKLVPHFISYIMSFIIIGLFWVDHHRAFGYVVNYDMGLLWNNLLLLMTIALLPFMSTLGAEYGYLSEAFMLYSLNLALIGFMNYFIWLKVTNPKRNLSAGLDDKNLRKYYRAKSFTTAFIFLAGAMLCMADVPVLLVIARYLFFSIFLAIAILRRVYRVGYAV